MRFIGLILLLSLKLFAIDATLEIVKNGKQNSLHYGRKARF